MSSIGDDSIGDEAMGRSTPVVSADVGTRVVPEELPDSPLQAVSANAASSASGVSRRTMGLMQPAGPTGLVAFGPCSSDVSCNRCDRRLVAS